MEKKTLKNIIKSVNKQGQVDLISSLTLEECDYLQSHGIAVTKSYYMRTTLMYDKKFIRETTSCSLDI